MNVYVETNFVLELVLQQEQSPSCENILHLCETKDIRLIVPAYSLAEPHEKLIRQANNRRELQQTLDSELRQLARTASYHARIGSIGEINRLLIRSNEEEQQRFVHYRDKLLQHAEIIELTTGILLNAATCEEPFDLRPQDAIVYASVLNHLRTDNPPIACFLNRNTKDFDNPDIDDELKRYKCRMIARFDQGYNFIQSQIKR